MQRHTHEQKVGFGFCTVEDAIEFAEIEVGKNPSRCRFQRSEVDVVDDKGDIVWTSIKDDDDCSTA